MFKDLISYIGVVCLVALLNGCGGGTAFEIKSQGNNRDGSAAGSGDLSQDGDDKTKVKVGDEDGKLNNKKPNGADDKGTTGGVTSGSDTGGTTGGTSGGDTGGTTGGDTAGTTGGDTGGGKTGGTHSGATAGGESGGRPGSDDGDGGDGCGNDDHGSKGDDDDDDHGSKGDDDDDDHGSKVDDDDMKACAKLSGVDVKKIKLAGKGNELNVSSGDIVLARVTGKDNSLGIEVVAASASENLAGMCLFAAGRENKILVDLKVNTAKIWAKVRGKDNVIKIKVHEGYNVNAATTDAGNNGGKIEFEGKGNYPGK